VGVAVDDAPQVRERTINYLAQTSGQTHVSVWPAREH
jgi:hypothetical protein